MAKEFRLPALGENVEAGDVVSVLVNPGDVISEGQAILELETDKATVEVPSEVAGTVQSLSVAPGDHLAVGQLVLTVEEGAAAPAKPAAKKTPEPVAEAAVEVEAAPEPEPEPVKPVEKPAVEPAPRADVVDFKKKPAGPQPRPVAATKLVAASPAVRRFAREIGVDISRVKGSGARGRITEDDVKNHARSRKEAEASSPLAVTAALPDQSAFGAVTREPFNNIRRATARHLSNAWLNIPHVTNHDQADVTELEALRKKYSQAAESAGGKLTLTAIVLKVVAAALHRFPKFNASIDMANEEVVYKHFFNVGVAVDTERGLLVPVLRDVDQKNIIELSVELKELADRARTGKIGLDELQGGCFTITNLGGIGGTSFTPIVNLPEVAILGLSRSTVQPIFVDGEFEPRLMLPLSLSYDHRLIDGADAARFLRWVATALEEPFLLALEG
ncbi:MAG: 2-oxo acid dehydrogenase subunit E2 [Acidobacteriota bacterium]|nr:MAG: 2-oxo acid dehydrogenase subunit E2 [Acidobacteriota bacterium]